MVLLVAVVAGLLAGWLRSRLRHSTYQVVDLRSVWIVFLAFIPQLLAFSIPATREYIPDSWIPFILLGSQALLFIFVWENREKPGLWLLGIGLLLNFLVIALNGGFMPLSPEKAQHLIPPGVTVDLVLGERVGYGKDILLPTAETTLWFLSDIFLLPSWINYRVAFSLGDILISAGAFYFLWSLGGSSQNNSLEAQHVKDL